MYCPKCGKEMREGDTFCSACGNKINNSSESTGIIKNVGVKPLLLSLLVQGISLCILLVCSGTVAAVMARIFAVLLIITLGLSIFCIVKSKHATNHKGRALGIVFTVLTTLFIIIIGLSLLTNKDNINIQVRDTANEAVEVLRDNLKSPSSLYLNSAFVEVKSSKTEIIIDGVKQNADEPFEGTYTVYFDYSAENGFGGTTRAYYQVTYAVIGTDRTFVRAKSIETMPDLTGTIYDIDVEGLTAYTDARK